MRLPSCHCQTLGSVLESDLILRYNFNDSQVSKHVRNRRKVAIKSHMRLFISKGEETTETTPVTWRLQFKSMGGGGERRGERVLRHVEGIAIPLQKFKTLCKIWSWRGTALLASNLWTLELFLWVYWVYNVGKGKFFFSLRLPQN